MLSYRSRSKSLNNVLPLHLLHIFLPRADLQNVLSTPWLYQYRVRAPTLNIGRFREMDTEGNSGEVVIRESVTEEEFGEVQESFLHK